VIQPAYSLGATSASSPATTTTPASLASFYFQLSWWTEVAVNPKTGRTYPIGRATLFDPASYPSNGSPYSGIVQYDSKFFHTPPIQLGPRAGFAWNSRKWQDGASRWFRYLLRLPYGVDTIGASNSGTGPMAARAAFQSPIFYNTTFANLLNSQAFLGPQNVNGDRKI